MKLLTYIPARGGSKGILKKNLSTVGDKKLIDFTLDAAKNIKTNSINFVSTDNAEIANYCKTKGFDVDYMRPSSLSQDNSSIVEGLLDALEWLKIKKNFIPSDVLLLQPTSPFRNITQLNEYINLKSI